MYLPLLLALHLTVCLSLVIRASTLLYYYMLPCLCVSGHAIVCVWKLFPLFSIFWNFIYLSKLSSDIASLVMLVICCCFSVTESYLCNCMDCSTPGIPVLHWLLEFTQTHVPRISDAFQPSHPLSPPSPPALNLFLASGFGSNESDMCIRWPKDWNFSFSISPSSEYSVLIPFRINWFDLFCCPRDS